MLIKKVDYTFYTRYLTNFNKSKLNMQQRKKEKICNVPNLGP